MLSSNSRRRVIIKNVSPQIEGGKYAAKGTINEELIISADIFCDGHDEIGTSILLKHKKDRVWKELPMQFMTNDCWEFKLIPQKLGVYEFQILGWVDHFTTWKKGLVKKYEAGQDISVEIQIGVQILENAAQKAAKASQGNIKKWIKELQSSKDPSAAVLIATGDNLSALMRTCREEDMTTIYPQIFQIDVERRKASFSTWYELFPRSTAQEQGRHGTFKDVINLLPRISKMGFDTLYIPPIHPIGEEKRKGRNNSLVANADDPGSPWAIGSKDGGHMSIHTQLGTIQDFKKLVSEAKKLDIEIALDIAFQCAPDHPYVKLYPQWFKWRPDGTVQYAENPPKKYEDILPFNFETEDWENLWKELKNVLEFWIDKGVQIFRIDNPHTKAFAFWEWAISEIRNKYPQIIFLAEAFTRPRIMEQLAKAGFNQSYTYFTWRTTKKEIEKYITELTRTDRRYYFRPNFWPNTPDILPPHLTYGGESAHISRVILAATLSSNYGLYGPVYEFGLTEPMPGKEEYIDNEKYEIKHWDWNKYTRIREVITRLNKIRKENTALQSTWNIEFAATTNENIICYIKRDNYTGNTLIVVVNLDPYNVQSASVDILTENIGIDTETYTVHDLLGGDTYNWKHGWNYVELNPEMPAHILKLENNTAE